MGPMYGFQWRHFGEGIHYTGSDKKYKGIDQLKNLIKEIKNNPMSRRLIITDFNPSDVKKGVLYPCHSIILQFYVNDRYLSVKMYQRSADVFLGLPFNIASTSLLLSIISKITNLKPGKVSITLGDCHIYEQHFDAITTFFKNDIYKLPTISIPSFKTLEDVEVSISTEYILNNYKCNKVIKAPMIP